MTDQERKDLEATVKEMVKSAMGDRGTVIERHAQTIMVGLVTIGIVFVSSSITDQNADIRVLQSQVQDLKEFVRDTQGEFVTETQFQLHQRENERRFSRLEDHLDLPHGEFDR